MHEHPVQKTSIIIACCVAVLFNLGDYLSGHKPRSFAVFCDVGQGDGSYIHIEPNLDILIDTGKYSSVDNCIRKHNASFDEVVDAVFISHLQTDHFGGVESIIRRYTIRTVYVNLSPNMNREARMLLDHLRSHRVPVRSVVAGDTFESGGVVVSVLWPTVDYLHALKQNSDPNEMSQVLRFSYRNWSILYTGDIVADRWISLSDEPALKSDILKVPHHGSKNGLNRDLLLLADPTYSVISVGRNNAYGHPSPEVLKLLEQNKSKILRTDILGDVIFLLD